MPTIAEFDVRRRDPSNSNSSRVHAGARILGPSFSPVVALRLRALRSEARATLLAGDEECVGCRDLDEGHWRSADAAAHVDGTTFSVGIENLDNLRHLRCPLKDSFRDLIDGHQYLPVLRICLTSAIISFTSSTVIDH